MMAPPADRPVAFHAPWFDDREIDAVRAALSGHVSGDGPIGRRVEARLAAQLGAHRVLLTTSGTHAIELALLALRIGPGQRRVAATLLRLPLHPLLTGEEVERVVEAVRETGT